MHESRHTHVRMHESTHAHEREHAHTHTHEGTHTNEHVRTLGIPTQPPKAVTGLIPPFTIVFRTYIMKYYFPSGCTMNNLHFLLAFLVFP